LENRYLSGSQRIAHTARFVGIDYSNFQNNRK